MTVVLERPAETEEAAPMRAPLRQTGRNLLPHTASVAADLMIVRAHISQEVIARSVPGSPTMCMLALGLAEAGFLDPHIEEGNCSVGGYAGMDGPHELVLHDEIIKVVRAFDQGEEVEPFDFFLTFHV